MNFGEAVRAARIHLGLTQTQLAERVGLKSYLSIAFIEKGEPAKLQTIERLWDVLSLWRAGGTWGFHQTCPAKPRPKPGRKPAPEGGEKP